MGSIAEILMFVLGFAWWVIIIQAIMSWLISFNVLNIRQALVYQIWSGLNRITEPVYRPIRKVLPPMGGLDLTPIVVLIGIFALQTIIRNNLY
ncbi:MAG: YggT family protein [Pseudomonadota bacterium]